ncbi:hypothetical protein [Streptomyces sp. NPDC005573]|uniref:hypothetical protein n=1 Tax=Streptomyces sp. NPDC005573 TaxID=3156890 RepID=UPI0033AFF004
MVVYEYLPHELVRLGVAAKAAGLDRSRVGAEVRLALERVGRARVAAPEPHSLSELCIAQWRCRQWERIASVTGDGQMPVYVPSRDSRVVRYEHQRVQRLVRDVAEAERSGADVVAIARYRVYRINAQSVSGCSAGLPVLTLHLMSPSPERAVEQAWAVHGRDGGLYQRGGYRIISVEQALPGPGELF